MNGIAVNETKPNKEARIKAILMEVDYLTEGLVDELVKQILEAIE